MAFMNKYMANKRGVLTKRSILKNVVVLNLSFVLSYAAGNCVNSIQSIVNQSQSMGTISQSISFASNILTSLVIPQFICDLIGFKLTLALGELFNLCFVVVQIYPTWFTLAPSKSNRLVSQRIELYYLIVFTSLYTVWSGQLDLLVYLWCVSYNV